MFLFIYGKELKNFGFKKYDFKGKFIEVILNLVNRKKIYMKVRPHLINSTSVQKNINPNSYNYLINVV